MYLNNLTSDLRKHIITVIETSLTKLDREFSEQDEDALEFFDYPVTSELDLFRIDQHGNTLNSDLEVNGSIHQMAEDGLINIMDLASLADELAALAEVDEKIYIHAATISHPNGQDIIIQPTYKLLEAEVASFCIQNEDNYNENMPEWDNEGEDISFGEMSNEDIISEYFGRMSEVAFKEEYWDYEKHPLYLSDNV